jgi:prolyl-tRNA editing enzyme YbaK/EbsC (Cys-tRNA(Pro) deacylase)
MTVDADTAEDGAGGGGSPPKGIADRETMVDDASFTDQTLVHVRCGECQIRFVIWPRSESLRLDPII